MFLTNDNNKGDYYFRNAITFTSHSSANTIVKIFFYNINILISVL